MRETYCSPQPQARRAIRLRRAPASYSAATSPQRRMQAMEKRRRSHRRRRHGTRSASRDLGPSAPEPVEAAPAVKPRRNLLFSSSSRKERERAQARTADLSVADLPPAPAAVPPTSDQPEAPPATFDDAWPKPERSRTADVAPPRRSGRAPSTFTEA